MFVFSGHCVCFTNFSLFPISMSFSPRPPCLQFSILLKFFEPSYNANPWYDNSSDEPIVPIDSECETTIPASDDFFESEKYNKSSSDFRSEVESLKYPSPVLHSKVAEVRSGVGANGLSCAGGPDYEPATVTDNGAISTSFNSWVRGARLSIPTIPTIPTMPTSITSSVKTTRDTTRQRPGGVSSNKQANAVEKIEHEADLRHKAPFYDIASDDPHFQMVPHRMVCFLLTSLSHGRIYFFVLNTFIFFNVILNVYLNPHFVGQRPAGSQDGDEELSTIP